MQATLCAACCMLHTSPRDAAQSDELHRRFRVGAIPELLTKVGA